ncbi:sensor histidine kinase [Qipengyuania sp.]|uniref:sensor histidine kinase n=1 Tax=Qipengyuania sp. TaxID=2004515 RepID=UPI0035C86E9C
MSEEPMEDSHSLAFHDTQRRLEAVLNNASVAIFLMDDRQHCAYMNRAAEHLTGFTLVEVLALNKPLHDIIHHTHPDGRPFPLHECAIDRAFPEHNQMRGEECFVHKDGSFYPVAYTASPIRDDTSRTVGTIIEVRDITEEIRAAERQKLLVNELNHRVKNTLATVQSVAWQTFKQIDQEALERFNGRLAVLSRAHDILTDKAWHAGGLGAIVATAIEPFGADRFTVHGPDREIDPKAAVSLSMALHELGTNAVKYGSLSETSGRVEVSWTCDDAADHLNLDLVWQETGGPPVSPPTSQGFGTRLMERQMKLEFAGSAVLDWNPGGLICRMHLQLPYASGLKDLHVPSRVGG